MAVMDEFKEEREALKNGTLKERLQYFWYYYRWHVIGTILVLIVGGTLVHEVVTKKEEAFFAVFLNSTEMGAAAEYNQGFIEYAGIDPNEYECVFDNSMFISTASMDETTMASQQKLMVYIAASQIDVIAGGTEILEQYANNGNFYDLRDLLTAEQIAQYEPYFYYIDQTVVDAWNVARDNLELDYDPEVPDPSQPELMEEPVPVAIFVEECQGLTDSYYFSSGDRVALGVVLNTERPELAVQYIDYLFGAE